MDLETPPERQLQMIGRTLSHYRIIDQLGAGGMGQVYRAHDERLDRDVAIKVLPHGIVADESSRKRLRREALALAKLSHTNIGVVHDFDTAEGIDFIVMELVSGVTLDRKIASGALPEKEVVAIGGQIAAALSEAHELGIVHCDLKPSNIAITTKDQVKVLDFGLARLTHPVAERGATRSETGAHGVSGTLPYMAPEQLRGERLDARTDLYALGVVLYEITTGQRPFLGATAAQLIDSILHSTPHPPMRFQPGISAGVEHVILKCLEKDPRNRYQSAKEIEVDLRRTTLPTMTGTPPAAKRRTMVWGGALALAAVLLILSYFFWPRRQVNSVAVLPFVNATGDANLEYVGDGIAEELINGLTQVPGLKVIARPTAFVYRGRQEAPNTIGHELNVSALVMGRVTQQADQVTVQVDLVDTSEGAELWGGQFKRPQSEIQGISSDIVRQVLSSLRLKLTSEQESRLARRPVQSSDAYLLYLRGRSCLNSLDTRRFPECVEIFQQALAKHPGYAQALAGMADTYAYIAIMDVEPPRKYMPRAREAAMKALQLDDTVAEAHTSLGIVKLMFDFDFPGAELELRRAMELNPGDVFGRHWYAHYLEAIGRMEEANTEMQRISELDPLSTIYAGDLAEEYFFMGQYDKVVQMARTWTSFKDAGAYGWMFLARSYEQLNRRDESLRTARELAAADDSVLAQAFVAVIYARLGQREEALKILTRLEANSTSSYVSFYLLSLMHVSLGNNEAGLRYLARAVEERSGDIPLSLAYDPLFDPVRGDSRFVELVRRHKLPEIRQPK